MPKKKDKPEGKKVSISVKVETPWGDKNYEYEMKNVSWSLRHKHSRWGICVLKGLQTEFGNTVKPK